MGSLPGAGPAITRRRGVGGLSIRSGWLQTTLPAAGRASSCRVSSAVPSSRAGRDSWSAVAVARTPVTGGCTRRRTGRSVRGRIVAAVSVRRQRDCGVRAGRNYLDRPILRFVRATRSTTRFLPHRSMSWNAARSRSRDAPMMHGRGSEDLLSAVEIGIEDERGSSRSFYGPRSRTA